MNTKEKENSKISTNEIKKKERIKHQQFSINKKQKNKKKNKQTNKQTKQQKNLVRTRFDILAQRASGLRPKKPKTMNL